MMISHVLVILILIFFLCAFVMPYVMMMSLCVFDVIDDARSLAEKRIQVAEDKQKEMEDRLFKLQTVAKLLTKQIKKKKKKLVLNEEVDKDSVTSK
jgi:F0F1-type ATP synthase membrane subunit b/b'